MMCFSKVAAEVIPKAFRNKFEGFYTLSVDKIKQPARAL